MHFSVFVVFGNWHALSVFVVFCSLWLIFSSAAARQLFGESNPQPFFITSIVLPSAASEMGPCQKSEFKQWTKGVLKDHRNKETGDAAASSSASASSAPPAATAVPPSSRAIGLESPPPAFLYGIGRATPLPASEMPPSSRTLGMTEPFAASPAQPVSSSSRAPIALAKVANALKAMKAMKKAVKAMKKELTSAQYTLKLMRDRVSIAEEARFQLEQDVAALWSRADELQRMHARLLRLELHAPEAVSPS
jgi:hypothetical protein